MSTACLQAHVSHEMRLHVQRPQARAGAPERCSSHRSHHDSQTTSHRTPTTVGLMRLPSQLPLARVVIVAMHRLNHHHRVRPQAQHRQTLLLLASTLVDSRRTSVVAGQVHRRFRQTCPAHQAGLAVVGHRKGLCLHPEVAVRQQGLHSTTTEVHAMQIQCEPSTAY